jgi:hypothetical protein
MAGLVADDRPISAVTVRKDVICPAAGYGCAPSGSCTVGHGRCGPLIAGRTRRQIRKGCRLQRAA